MGINNLCYNAHFLFTILQYRCFNRTYYTCSYVKWIWDMSSIEQTIQLLICKVQVMDEYLDIGLLLSAGIPTMHYSCWLNNHNANFVHIPGHPFCHWVDVWPTSTRAQGWLKLATLKLPISSSTNYRSATIM